MAKAKKSAAQATPQSEASVKAGDMVEARPIGEGKDPLADGNTLVNPSNTEAETHYEVKESSEEVSKIDGQNANQRAEEHNAQAGQVNDTPQQVEVPNRTEKQQEEDAADREEAVTEAYNNEK